MIRANKARAPLDFIGGNQIDHPEENSFAFQSGMKEGLKAIEANLAITKAAANPFGTRTEH